MGMIDGYVHHTTATTARCIVFQVIVVLFFNPLFWGPSVQASAFEPASCLLLCREEVPSRKPTPQGFDPRGKRRTAVTGGSTAVLVRDQDDNRQCCLPDAACVCHKSTAVVAVAALLLLLFYQSVCCWCTAAVRRERDKRLVVIAAQKKTRRGAAPLPCWPLCGLLPPWCVLSPPTSTNRTCPLLTRSSSRARNCC